MSSLRVMTAVLPSLSPSPASDPDKGNPGVNAAFTGVLDRVATRPADADPKSSKDSIGLGSSAKRARSDSGTSGSDEKDAEPPEGNPPASTTTPAGTATLDISALAQAALIPAGSAVPPTAKTQTAGPKAIPEAGPATSTAGADQGTVPTTSSATAALQAIVQQPGRPASSQVGISQSTGAVPSLNTAAAPATTGAAAAPPLQAQGEPSSGSAATALNPAGSALTAVANGSSAANDAKAAGAASSTLVPTTSGTTATIGAAPTVPSRQASATETARAAKGGGATSGTGAPTNSGTAASGTAPAIPSEDASGIDARARAGGTPQASQPSTDAAQAAAVAASPQPLPNAATPQASTPAPAAVRPAVQTGTRPTPAGPLRAGTGASAKSPLPDMTAMPSLSTFDSVPSKRGKDKASAATVVAAASNDLPVVATPAQQVVTALQSFGKDVAPTARGSAAPTTASADVTTRESSGTSTLKTLTIELNPAHLGPVSITMRLQAETMDIRIAVSNPDTLHLLDKDKHLLAAAVEAMGGSRENLQVGTLAQMSGSGDPATTGGQNQNTPGRQDAASSDTSSNGHQAQGQSRSTLQNSSQSDADEPTSTPPLPQARGLDGSLYL